MAVRTGSNERRKPATKLERKRAVPKPTVIIDMDAESRRLFDETPYLYTEAEVQKVRERCWSMGAVAAIDWLEAAGRWAFHAMYLRGSVSKRPDLAAYFEGDPRALPERKMEDLLCKVLEERGTAWRRQVRCDAGIADIVTNNRVCELKATITFQSLAQAVGQALMYAACIGGNRKPTVIGNVIDPDLFWLADRTGVELISVDDALSCGLD